MTQIGRKFKTIDKERLLELQNELRKKYGLQPHKRLDTEFLYALDDIQNDIQPKENNGGMYQ